MPREKDSRIVEDQRRQVRNDKRIPDPVEGTIRQEKRDRAKKIRK
jgi:hypothetical protein